MARQTEPCDYCGKLPCAFWDLAIHAPLEDPRPEWARRGEAALRCYAYGQARAFDGPVATLRESQAVFGRTRVGTILVAQGAKVVELTRREIATIHDQG